MKEKNNSHTAAVVISVFLLALCLFSLLSLLLPKKAEDHYAADIFQNGNLLRSIPLDGTIQQETFTVRGESGCVNEIQIQGRRIRILSADCPDRLCVQQGFIQDSRLPIVCLPNRLVIHLRPVDSDELSQEPDILTY